MIENKELLKMFDGYVEENEKLTAKLISQFTCFMIQYRLDHHLTQKEMAEKLHISQAMISKIEHEDYNFTLNMMAKICYQLNYDIDILLKDLNITNDYSSYQQPLMLRAVCEPSIQYHQNEKVGIDLSQIDYELKENVIYLDKSVLESLLKDK